MQVAAEVSKVGFVIVPPGIGVDVFRPGFAAVGGESDDDRPLGPDQLLPADRDISPRCGDVGVARRAAGRVIHLDHARDIESALVGVAEVDVVAGVPDEIEAAAVRGCLDMT